jgi:hypothetical protein
LEEPAPHRRHRCFGGGPTPPLSVAPGSRCRSYATPGSHRWEPHGGGGRTRGWLETTGTSEAPWRREEAGPRWLPDSSERRPVAWVKAPLRKVKLAAPAALGLVTLWRQHLARSSAVRARQQAKERDGENILAHGIMVGPRSHRSGVSEIFSFVL